MRCKEKSHFMYSVGQLKGLKRCHCSITLLSLLIVIGQLQRAVSFLPALEQIRKRKSSSPLYSADEGIGIGIDLGTTYSAVAILRENIPVIVPIPGYGRTMPSIVSLSQENGQEQVWVGQEALQKENDLGAYRNVKRVIGTGGKIAQSVVKGVPFVITSSSGRTFKKDSLLNQIQDASEHSTKLRLSYSRGQTIMPEDISAHVIRKLKQTVEDAVGKKVTRAVIGVPAYFHDAQREATKRAAQLAGIDKVKLLREPEAAALAYGIGREQLGVDDENDEELVLVFDLGGGTFDVSILLVGGGITEIISTSGNAQLGGSDLDTRVAEYIQGLLRKHWATGTANVWSDNAKAALLRASEQIRINLSNNRRVNLALPLEPGHWSCLEHDRAVILPLDFAGADEFTEASISNGTHALCYLSRRRLESLCKEELHALLRPVREVAIMSGALLPGDSSPGTVMAALELEEELGSSAQNELAFRDFYEDESQVGATASRQDAGINPDMLMQLQALDIKASKNAQQQGRQKARKVAKDEKKYRQEKRKLETRDKKVTLQAQADRVKVRDGISGRPISRVVLVGGATRMPAIGRLISALTGVVPQRTVNPDEAVALGCAVHVGVLDGTVGMGTVLNPMQAAILKAVAQRDGVLGNDFDDDEELDEAEYY